MAALYFGNCIIGVQGDPGCQPDPWHLCFRFLLSLFAWHMGKVVIASHHLDVLLSMRQFILANGERVCQVGKTKRVEAGKRRLMDI